jgi:hypothetical protein
MNQPHDIDRVVAAWLRTAGPADIRPGAVDRALAVAATARQRRGVRLALTGPAPWPTYGRRIGFGTLPPAVRLALVLLLTLAAMGAVAAVGSRLLHLTPVLPRIYHGELVPAPDLVIPRSAPVLVALGDGRLLVLGGGGQGTSAEVFDPMTGASVLTGPMISGESLVVSSAVLLSDGRVLVVGDARPSDASFRSVIFDPGTMQFAPTGPMIIARAGAVLGLLPDGDVLMAGGTLPDDPDTRLSSAEIFDPVSGSFSMTGSMQTARSQLLVAPLMDGHLFIVGGEPGSPGDRSTIDSAEVYDPETGTFDPTSDRTPDRLMDGSSGALALADGRVAIVGAKWEGLGSFLVTPGWLVIWDPRSRTFSAPIRLPHWVHSQVLLDDGRVLLIGPTGFDASWSGIFDPATGVTLETAAPKAWWGRAVRIADGRVLIVGGIEDGNTHGVSGYSAPAVATMEYFQ